MSTRRNPPWQDLPQEVLSTISNLLTSNSIDILAFRSVCKSWYSSSPPIYAFTLSTITAPSPGYTFDYRFGLKNSGIPIISTTAIFAIRQQSHDQIPYIMFADQLTPSKFIIRKPFTNRSYAMPFNFPRYLDVPNVHVSEIGRFYNFSFHSEVNKPPSIWCECVQKVVMNSDETVAVALFHSGLLGLSELRSLPATCWYCIYSWDHGGFKSPIDDVVNYKGRILCVDRVGRLIDVAWSKLGGFRLICGGISGIGRKRKRLVESNGVLYLVVRGRVFCSEEDDDVEIEGFTVYEFIEDHGTWVEVSCVGGMVLFFGLNFSFSVSPQELGDSFGKDCVVFQEGSFRDYEVVDGGGVGDNDDNDGDGDGNGDADTDESDCDEDGDGDRDEDVDGNDVDYESVVGVDVDIDNNGNANEDTEGDEDGEEDTDGDGDGDGDECEYEYGDGNGNRNRNDDDESDGDGDGSDDMLFSHLRYKDLPIGVWHMKNAWHSGKIGSYPGCSELLWPPPSWLWPVDISKRMVDLEAALDDLLVNAHAEKSKAMSNDLFLEQVIVKEIRRVAHIIKKCLYKAKDFHNSAEKVKTNDVSRQAGSSALTEEGQRSAVNMIQNTSEHSETRATSLSDDIKIDSAILYLEEITIELQNRLKSRQQTSVDAVVCASSFLSI